MTGTDNRETALNLVLGIDNGVDPASVTSDFTWWIQGRGDLPLAKFNEMLAAIGGMRDGTSTPKVWGVTSEGDRVAIEVEGNTPLKGGRVYSNSYHFLVLFRDGVPCKVKEYYNAAYAADVFASDSNVVAVNQPEDDEDAEPDVGGATLEERKALAIKLIRSAATPTLATDLVTPDIRWWVPGAGTMKLSRFERVLSEFGRMWASPGEVDLIGITGEGTRIALETETRIPLTDGRTYHNSYHILVKFRGDKIRQVREYNDSGYFRKFFSELTGSDRFDGGQ
jgi:ketosteroid isomerase-like protein